MIAHCIAFTAAFALVSTMSAEAQVLEPLSPFSPQSMAECQKYSDEWNQHVIYLADQLRQCTDRVNEMCRAQGWGSRTCTDAVGSGRVRDGRCGKLTNAPACEPQENEHQCGILRMRSAVQSCDKSVETEQRRKDEERESEQKQAEAQQLLDNEAKDQTDNEQKKEDARAKADREKEREQRTTNQQEQKKREQEDIEEAVARELEIQRIREAHNRQIVQEQQSMLSKLMDPKVHDTHSGLADRFPRSQRAAEQKKGSPHEYNSGLADPFSEGIPAVEPNDATLVDPFALTPKPDSAIENKPSTLREDEKVWDYALRVAESGAKMIRSEMVRKTDSARLTLTAGEFRRYNKNTNDVIAISSGFSKCLTYIDVARKADLIIEADPGKNREYQSGKVAYDAATHFAQDLSTKGFTPVVEQLFPRAAPYIIDSFSAALGAGAVLLDSNRTSDYHEVIQDDSGRFSVADKQDALAHLMKEYEETGNRWIAPDVEKLAVEARKVYIEAEVLKENKDESH